MTYCIDFFRKFKKEGNFCGLDKTQVSRLTAYLEIVEMLMKQKIPEEQIYKNFTVGAATPLLAAKDKARTDGLNYVTSQLKEGKKIQGKDLQLSLGSCKFTTPPTDKSCSTTTPETKSKPEKEKEPKKPEPVEPVLLHPELKTSPSQPAPNSIPVTDAPPIKSLGELSREDDKLAEQEDDVTPLELDKLREIEASIAMPRKAPCLSNEPCPSPDGKDHCIRDGKGRRFKCALWNQFITQMVRDECYFDVKRRRNVERAAGGDTGFVRASGLVSKPPQSTQTLPTISKHPLLKTRKEQDAATDRFINDCLSDRYHRVIRDAMTDHSLPAPLDVLCKGLDLLSEWEGERS